jgi:hypothetical protein
VFPKVSTDGKDVNLLSVSIKKIFSLLYNRNDYDLLNQNVRLLSTTAEFCVDALN